MREHAGRALTACAALCLLCGCTPSADERCEAGFEYHPKTGSCHEIGDGGTDAGDDPTDGGDAGDLPSGLGEDCLSDEDCEGYEADYCAINPLTEEGFCTVKNCTVEPNDCPAGYMCCDSPEWIGEPNACVLHADYETLHDMDLCA